MIKNGTKVNLLIFIQQIPIDKIDNWTELEDIIKILLRYGCNPNQIDNVDGKYVFRYAIDVALEYDEDTPEKEYDWIRIFLEYGPNSNIAIHDEIHPLQMVKKCSKLIMLLKRKLVRFVI